MKHLNAILDVLRLKIKERNYLFYLKKFKQKSNIFRISNFSCEGVYTDAKAATL